jgi:hypothetical protein
MDNTDKNLGHSINTQQKFEFYLLALVFTVLALSIQTAKQFSCIQSIIEILSWVSFLISGLAGLSRMEWIPVSYMYYSNLTKGKSFASEAKSGRNVLHESGRIMTDKEVADLVKEVDDRIEDRKNILKKIESRIEIKYTIHKWLFVIGLVLLIISRSISLISV